MKFVIVGLGSIGSRHKKNLENLDHQVISCHQNDNLEQILVEQKPNGVLVCNPTSVHLKTAIKVTKLGFPVFMEKPLSQNLEGVEFLRGTILVGYCLRFEEKLRQLKNKLTGINPKQIRSVTINCLSWLPDWHPNTDYRQSYSAKKELGGGVLLDVSHEIDYALWFFGPVKTVSAKLQMAPELEIETEAIADLRLEFVSGVKADIHLSYASHESRRDCMITTDKETLTWNYQSNNEMYIKEMKHFINVVAGKEKPLVTVTDGINVLKVIETAKINPL